MPWAKKGHFKTGTFLQNHFKANLTNLGYPPLMLLNEESRLQLPSCYPSFFPAFQAWALRCKLISLTFPVRLEGKLTTLKVTWNSLHPQGRSTTKCSLIKLQSSFKAKVPIIIPMVSTADLQDLVSCFEANTEMGNLFKRRTTCCYNNLSRVSLHLPSLPLQKALTDRASRGLKDSAPAYYLQLSGLTKITASLCFPVCKTRLGQLLFIRIFLFAW